MSKSNQDGWLSPYTVDEAHAKQKIKDEYLEIVAKIRKVD